MMTYGERIRSLRILAGLSQHAFGVAIGYSPTFAQSAVSQIEHDKHLPDLPKIRRMAKALGVSVDLLVPEDK